MKEVILTQGKVAIVDDEDYEKYGKYNWHFAGGYARRNVKLPNGKRKIVFLHRLIAATPKNKYTDHINGDTLDNRKSNLRNVDRDQNSRNARKHNLQGASKYKGVSFHKRDKDLIGKWVARIQVDKKIIRLGYFNSEIQAAEAYNEAAIQHHGEFCSLNEIETINFYDYQRQASRTIPDEKWFNTKASNFCMGLSGEVGEVVDHLKKVIYHGHEINRDEIAKELGDVLWYLSGLATILNIDMDEIAKLNLEKLRKRYPKGFNPSDSINRKE